METIKGPKEGFFSYSSAQTRANLKTKETGVYWTAVYSYLTDKWIVTPRFNLSF